MVSDLKKEFMNEVKVILSKKDKKVKVLKSQVTLLQSYVSAVKHALNKKVGELEQYESISINWGSEKNWSTL